MPTNRAHGRSGLEPSGREWLGPGADRAGLGRTSEPLEGLCPLRQTPGAPYRIRVGVDQLGKSHHFEPGAVPRRSVEAGLEPPTPVRARQGHPVEVMGSSQSGAIASASLAAAKTAAQRTCPLRCS